MSGDYIIWDMQSGKVCKTHDTFADADTEAKRLSEKHKGSKVFGVYKCESSYSAIGKSEAEHDAVNHPKHYNSHPSGVECITVIRHMTLNIGNAVKYLWRNGLKDIAPQVEDLKKAIWYINDEIKRIENAN